VNVYNGTGELARTFLAYDPAFRCGVHVVTADVTGDLVPDTVIAPGPGRGPHFMVFSGADGAPVREWMAYDPAFAGGVFVAAADVNGHGAAEVITGAVPCGGPHVKVFDGRTGAALTGFFAYDSACRGGVTVASGDLSGDGRAEVLTGAGPGGGPHVKAFDLAGGAVVLSVFAYDPRYTGGVFVSAGDLDADGRADVITGAGAGGGPHVKAFSGRDGSVLASFTAYDRPFAGGVRVAAVDLDGDGRSEIATGAGPSGGRHVAAWAVPGLRLRAGFYAFDPTFTGGVFVG
jgi:hypothetical protein